MHCGVQALSQEQVFSVLCFDFFTTLPGPAAKTLTEDINNIAKRIFFIFLVLMLLQIIHAGLGSISSRSAGASKPWDSLGHYLHPKLEPWEWVRE